MDNYLVIETLPPEEIKYIYSLIDQFGEWQDGRVSYKGNDVTKINQQLRLTDSVKQKLADVVFSNVDNNDEFYGFTAARFSGTPMVTRTNIGGYYRPHHDSPDLGDYSTTLFLNNDYDGGELCLWINGEEKKFKPTAGSSVTYKTGTPHCVNEVTKGHRDVIVFWTHSVIKDPFMMEMFRGLKQVSNLISHGKCETLMDVHENPEFIIHSLMNSILRKSTN